MVFLELWHEALDSFRVATGPLGTSCLASDKSSLLVSCEGFVGLLSRHCKGIGPHLAWWWGWGGAVARGVVQGAAGNLGFFRAASGTSGHLSCGLWEIRPPFNLQGHIEITLQSLLGKRESS